MSSDDSGVFVRDETREFALLHAVLLIESWTSRTALSKLNAEHLPGKLLCKDVFGVGVDGDDGDVYRRRLLESGEWRNVRSEKASSHSSRTDEDGSQQVKAREATGMRIYMRLLRAVGGRLLDASGALLGTRDVHSLPHVCH